jgi:hypothetical protein
MSFLDPLLRVNDAERDTIQVIGWWELRRVLYNGILLLAGCISLTIMQLLVTVEPGEDLVEPFTVIGFAFLCNVGYTFGWISELTVKSDKQYGPKLFKSGLGFSLCLVALPALIHIVYAIWKVLF